MTLVVEDGSGIISANSYAGRGLVEAYLRARNRQDENGWAGLSEADKDGFIVQAVDYIEQRFGHRFLGQQEYSQQKAAQSTLTLTALPTDGTTVTLDGQAYTFNTTLGGAYSVLIATTMSGSIDNLIAAVAGGSGEGTLYGTGTVASTTVELAAHHALTAVAKAKTNGEDGNSIAVATDVVGATWNFATLTGGNDLGLPQALSFPRAYLYTTTGYLVQGVPVKLQNAVCEYAVRAAASALMPDPTLDESGRTVRSKTEKIGPITETVQYEPGTGGADRLRSYPAADQLLLPYLGPTGGVVRG